MMSRPLMTVDELKTMPRFHFIVAKTGVNPMRTKLDLVFKWGIELNDNYEAEKHEVKMVHYAGKDELIAEIERREGTGMGYGSKASARTPGGTSWNPDEPVIDMEKRGMRTNARKER